MESYYVIKISNKVRRDEKTWGLFDRQIEDHPLFEMAISEKDFNLRSILEAITKNIEEPLVLDDIVAGKEAKQ